MLLPETENSRTVLIWNVLQSPPLAVFLPVVSRKGGRFLVITKRARLGVQDRAEKMMQRKF